MQRLRYRVATLKAAGFEHQVYNKQQLRLYAIFRIANHLVCAFYASCITQTST